MGDIWDALRKKDSTALRELIARGADVNAIGAVRAALPQCAVRAALPL